jgi:N-acetylglutamate synthase-like GNAT family acetyltransferase
MNMTIRGLAESELRVADRIFRHAFAAEMQCWGMTGDAITTFTDAAHIRVRWRANPENAYAAEIDGKLAGSNFLTRWGSVAYFGPLTVRPAMWNNGIGKALVKEALDRFDASRIKRCGLFTFASSKHISFYRNFGFWPRFSTAILAREITAVSAESDYQLWSLLSAADMKERRAECIIVTDSIFSDLDVTNEIDSVYCQSLGDTVMTVDKRGHVEGFAVCHCGPGSEAGNGTCYVKFAAMHRSAASSRFDILLDSCEHFAALRGLNRLVCGMNYARAEAMKVLAARGYRALMHGVAMHRDNAEIYNRSNVFVIDDWR